ncbi:MAG: DUF2442 domain-containing protein [Verrucomicrobia bacterium]|nr:MAG: DUF2442 domain-containing protein [Verrucomicrobiota bacterium]TAE85496.1 MAG: DUF2442 domain-containing protein [Verrucomicrobiota bacterium]TAF25875.1 MAG: DUF2442 domain-containing protein [Verrucomicrobiota bacterium]
MNTLIDTPRSACLEGPEIVIEMSSGETIRFPIESSVRLKSATLEELSEIELSPFGLHWPRLDEDLSIRGILAMQLRKD